MTPEEAPSTAAKKEAQKSSSSEDKDKKDDKKDSDSSKNDKANDADVKAQLLDTWHYEADRAIAMKTEKDRTCKHSYILKEEQI